LSWPKAGSTLGRDMTILLMGGILSLSKPVGQINPSRQAKHGEELASDDC
jgi:hypothetical protein